MKIWFEKKQSFCSTKEAGLLNKRKRKRVKKINIINYIFYEYMVIFETLFISKRIY